MSASSSDLAVSMPRLSSVRPLDKLSIEVVWVEGPRSGRTDVVDLSPLVQTHKFYQRLRNDPALFASVHLMDDGEVIAWGDEETIDMAATSVERLADDTMSADEFRSFMSELGYTQHVAAAQLGYSRRQIANFLAGTAPIPRVCVLACKMLRTRHRIKQARASASRIDEVHLTVA
jgi:hypothetical protein